MVVGIGDVYSGVELEMQISGPRWPMSATTRDHVYPGLTEVSLTPIFCTTHLGHSRSC